MHVHGLVLMMGLPKHIENLPQPPGCTLTCGCSQGERKVSMIAELAEKDARVPNRVRVQRGEE